MLRTVAFLTLLIPLAAMADWEYRVIYLPMSETELEHADGYATDTRKTEVLNVLSEEGWEIVSVTGAAGSDQVIYLRRQAN